MNTKIPQLLALVKYTPLDQAIGMVKQCGGGAPMAKADIQSAFRLLPIHPEDFCHRGFQFEGGFYVDMVMIWDYPYRATILNTSAPSLNG